MRYKIESVSLYFICLPTVSSRSGHSPPPRPPPSPYPRDGMYSTVCIYACMDRTVPPSSSASSIPGPETRPTLFNS
jgi:hypothetical protein